MRFGKPQQLPPGQRVNPGRTETPRPAAQPAKPLQSGASLTQESQVEFDPSGGHTHDGSSGGKQIPHSNLTGIGPDDHHAQQHALSGPDHTGTLGAGQHGTLADGDHTGNLSGNARVEIRKAGVSFGKRRAVNLIEGSNVTLTVADDPANEEVDVAINAASMALPIPESDVTFADTGHQHGGGNDGAQIPFSNLSGALSAGQHGSLEDGDHTGPLSGNARVGVQEEGVVVGTRRTIDFRAGPNITLNVTDDAVGERVTVRITAAAGATGTTAAPVQAWRRNAIQNAGTIKGEMFGLEGVQTGMTVPFSGTILGISVDLDGDISNDSLDWYEVEAYVNGVATLLKARITGGAGTESSAYATGSVAFNAGDKLTIYDQRQNLGTSGRASKATLFVQFD